MRDRNKNIYDKTNSNMNRFNNFLNHHHIEVGSDYLCCENKDID